MNISLMVEGSRRGRIIEALWVEAIVAAGKGNTEWTGGVLKSISIVTGTPLDEIHEEHLQRCSKRRGRPQAPEADPIAPEAPQRRLERKLDGWRTGPTSIMDQGGTDG